MVPQPQLMAYGQISQGLTAGVKAQNVVGCTVLGGGVGLRQVTLDDLGAGTDDVIVHHNPGFGTSKAGGGFSTTLGSMASGVFLIEIWDQTTVPPALADADVMFSVWRIPRVK